MLIGMPPTRYPDAFGNVHVARDQRGLAELRNPGSYRGKHRRTDALGMWPVKAVLYAAALNRFLRWAEQDFQIAQSEEIDDV